MKQLIFWRLRKEYDRAVCCLFNLNAKHIMRNAGLDELQAGIKIGGRNINNLRYVDDTTLKAESEEEPLDEHEGGEWKSWFKTKEKTKIMASVPITSWQIGQKKVEVGTNFFFLSSKITVDGDCGHEIRRCLISWQDS